MKKPITMWTMVLSLILLCGITQVRAQENTRRPDNNTSSASKNSKESKGKELNTFRIDTTNEADQAPKIDKEKEALKAKGKSAPDQSIFDYYETNQNAKVIEERQHQIEIRNKENEKRKAYAEHMKLFKEAEIKRLEKEELEKKKKETQSSAQYEQVKKDLYENNPDEYNRLYNSGEPTKTQEITKEQYEKLSPEAKERVNSSPNIKVKGGK